jgi:hypothetical protein
MYVRFKIHKCIHKQFDQSIYNQLENQFPNYIIEFCDENRIAFKRKVFLSGNYGNNMRYATNFIKNFEIKKLDSELHLLVDINHLLFVLTISLIGGSLFFLTKFNPNISQLAMLGFIVCSVILYSTYYRIKYNIKIVLKVIEQ